MPRAEYNLLEPGKSLLALSGVNAARSAQKYANMKKRLLREEADAKALEALAYAARVAREVEPGARLINVRPALAGEDAERILEEAEKRREGIEKQFNRLKELLREAEEWRSVYNTTRALIEHDFSNIDRELLQALVTHWEVVHSSKIRRKPLRAFTDLWLASLGVVRVRDSILRTLGYNAFMFITEDLVNAVRNYLERSG